MKFEKKLFCHSAMLHLITEDDLAERDCISVVDNKQVPLMLFLGKADNGNDYEVRVYKAKPTDYYIPNKCDVFWKSYKANNKFASFSFSNFTEALKFLIDLKLLHPEFRERPTSRKS